MRSAILCVLAGSVLAGQSVRADDTAGEINTLKQQVQELNRKIEALEQREQLAGQSATNEPPVQPKSRAMITAGANGFMFRSADTNFTIALHGVLQLDSRTFFHDYIRGNDGFILRRARPVLQGTVFKDFDFLLVPDFGGNTVQIFDAYLNYRYSSELQLQAGKFKSPVGLETLQSDVNTTFNERALATDLVPNRDLGVELHGDIADGAVGYAAGIFNGAPDYNGTTTNADYDNDKAFAGRLFLQPFKQAGLAGLRGLGFGLGGSYEVDHSATNAAATGLTPGFTTDGQQRFFTYTNGAFANGAHWRIAPQGYYFYGPASLLGEYVISDQPVTRGAASADLRNTAWEITGGWVLTGENANYNDGVTPRHSFNPLQGYWGAWQVVGRYAELNVDKKAFPVFADPGTSASSADAWSAGINWYLNRDIRVDASYSYTTFTGGNGTKATVTKHPEQVLFTRVQLGF